VGDLDDGDMYVPDDAEPMLYTRDRRDPGQPSVVVSSEGDVPTTGDVKWTLGLGKRESHFTPYISIGA